MKKFNKALFIIQVLAIAAIISGFLFGGTINGMKVIFTGENQYGDLNKEYIENDFSSLEFKSSSKNIHIFETTEEKSYIEYYIKEKHEVIEIVELDDTYSFEIKRKPKTYSFFNYTIESKKHQTVNVYLNNSTYNEVSIRVYSGHVKIDANKIFNKLTINNTSGYVQINNANVLNNLDINVESGRIKIENTNVGSLMNIKSSSGSINYNNVTADKIETNISSGNIRATKIKADEFNIRVASGFINLTDIEGESLNIISKSGSVKLYNTKYMNNIIKSSSGSVTIEDNRNFTDLGFVVKTSSGSIKIKDIKFDEKSDNLNLYLIKYDIKVSSGNVRIN